MNNILRTALTYRENNDRLIYSYRGNTFLQGGELYDDEHDGRGRIDCSTLVHLALQGISYDLSPYVTGKTDEFFSGTCRWQPGREIPLGEVFAERGDRATDIRRAYGLARYCRETGMELAEDEPLQPGDLVFFRASESVVEEYYKYGAYLGISHVGIVTEDPERMINATGSSDHERNAAGFPVKLSRISNRGLLLVRARIPR